MVQKRLKRTPRKSAPDIVQFMTCLSQQVVFNSLAVFQYGFGEAYDSPGDFLDAFFEASIHAFVIAL